jgi:hypothetical protein
MDKESASTTADDLSQHPELCPLLDLDHNGNVVCFGRVSPIYEFDSGVLDDQS